MKAEPKHIVWYVLNVKALYEWLEENFEAYRIEEPRLSGDQLVDVIFMRTPVLLKRIRRSQFEACMFNLALNVSRDHWQDWLDRLNGPRHQHVVDYGKSKLFTVKSTSGDLIGAIEITLDSGHIL